MTTRLCKMDHGLTEGASCQELPRFSVPGATGRAIPGLRTAWPQMGELFKRQRGVLPSQPARVPNEAGMAATDDAARLTCHTS